MSKLLVLWILLATVLVPLVAARDRDPVRGLRKALFFGLGCFALYAFGLLVVYPRL